MKTTNEARIAFAALTLAFAAAINAQAGSKDARTASAAEARSASVQYGQGVAITFLTPATPEITVAVSKDGLAASETPKPTESKLHWRSQSVPNGPAITYSVRE